MEVNGSSKHHHDAEYRAWLKNIEKQYDGRRHWSAGVRFWRPKLDPAQLEARMSEIQQTHQGHAYQKLHYLNPSLEEDHGKYPDLDTYYSSTKRYPRRLVVQGTKAAHKDPRPRHWGQKRLKGNIPFIIKLASLCPDTSPHQNNRHDPTGDESRATTPDFEGLRKRVLKAMRNQATSRACDRIYSSVVLSQET